MTCETCSFETSRLTVNEWHTSPSDERLEQDLAQVVASVMTESVTRTLPTAWQGNYTANRAEAWIAERDCEGPTLLVVERSTGQAVGLMILFESVAERGTGVDVRLGYLLAEWAWGRGLASELVEGFVGWCRAHAEIRSLAGGAAGDNAASIRILEKNGFLPVEDDHHDSEADQLFELRLQP